MTFYLEPSIYAYNSMRLLVFLSQILSFTVFLPNYWAFLFTKAMCQVWWNSVNFVLSYSKKTSGFLFQNACAVWFYFVHSMRCVMSIVLQAVLVTTYVCVTVMMMMLLLLLIKSCLWYIARTMRQICAACCNAPLFVCWLQRYINRSLTFLLTYLFP